MNGILETGEVIALDSGVFYQAGGIQVALDRSVARFDCSIVLASVLQHLAATKPAESYFLNRNTRYFDNPNVRYIWRSSVANSVASSTVPSSTSRRTSAGKQNDSSC